MTPEDKRIVFQAAQWVGQSQRKVVKTIRQLAQTEENYLLLIREIDRVHSQLSQAQTLGAEATLTLVEWLTTLEDFDWRCAYCQAKPFRIMSHLIALPRGGTVLENCVPACYGCNRYKSNEQVRGRMRTYFANRMNSKADPIGSELCSARGAHQPASGTA